jgi:hypothetical protein
MAAVQAELDDESTVPGTAFPWPSQSRQLNGQCRAWARFAPAIPGTPPCGGSQSGREIESGKQVPSVWRYRKVPAKAQIAVEYVWYT